MWGGENGESEEVRIRVKSQLGTVTSTGRQT